MEMLFMLIMVGMQKAKLLSKFLLNLSQDEVQRLLQAQCQKQKVKYLLLLCHLSIQPTPTTETSMHTLTQAIGYWVTRCRPVINPSLGPGPRFAIK